MSGYDGVMQSAYDPMQVLASAVTPVVLVSATSILVSGVNSRYISIADKMRSLAQEFRIPHCLPERRACIGAQMNIFRDRIELVAWAVRVLYAAIGCFTAVVMTVTAALWRKPLEAVTLPLFAIGVCLIFTAIICQLLELHLSNRTVALEVSDIAADE